MAGPPTSHKQLWPRGPNKLVGSCVCHRTQRGAEGASPPFVLTPHFTAVPITTPAALVHQVNTGIAATYLADYDYERTSVRYRLE